MGGCASKPKVLKSDEAPPPAPEPVIEEAGAVSGEANDVVAAKGDVVKKDKEIMDDDIVEENGSKRRSLSHLFKENEESKEGSSENAKTSLEPVKQEEPSASVKVTDVSETKPIEAEKAEYIVKESTTPVVVDASMKAAGIEKAIEAAPTTVEPSSKKAIEAAPTTVEPSSKKAIETAPTTVEPSSEKAIETAPTTVEPSSEKAIETAPTVEPSSEKAIEAAATTEHSTNKTSEIAPTTESSAEKASEDSPAAEPFVQKAIEAIETLLPEMLLKGKSIKEEKPPVTETQKTEMLPKERITEEEKAVIETQKPEMLTKEKKTEEEKPYFLEEKGKEEKRSEVK